MVVGTTVSTTGVRGEFPLFERGMKLISSWVVESAIEMPTDGLIKHFASLHKLKNRWLGTYTSSNFLKESE